MTKNKVPVDSKALYTEERQLPARAAQEQPNQTPLTHPDAISNSPPPYTPSESYFSAAPTSSSSSPPVTGNPLPPPNAQRAQAPLKVTDTNRSIKGAFVIVGSGSGKNQPDAYFKTTNSSIATSVWFEKAAPEPVAVEAWTTNSSIDMSVYPPSGQQVAIRATSTNGSIRAALPSSFHGLLTVSTTNSRHTLSPELQARSVRVPHDDPSDRYVIAYEIGGSNGTSTAVLKTTNSRIEVGQVGDVEVKDRDGCLVC